ncbi:hypothetical protein Ancab_029435, partial [Ancistrocladus abbreviatus]
MDIFNCQTAPFRLFLHQFLVSDARNAGSLVIALLGMIDVARISLFDFSGYSYSECIADEYSERTALGGQETSSGEKRTP